MFLASLVSGLFEEAEFSTLKYDKGSDKTVQTRIKNTIHVFFSVNRIKEITGSLMTGECISWPLASHGSWPMAASVAGDVSSGRR